MPNENPSTMRSLPCALLALAVTTLSAQEAFFIPKTQASAINAVPLDVRPDTGLPILHARLDGVPCALLFDTGATHTTFDRGFIERAFPERPLRPIALGGTTNVTSGPAAFRVGALTLGNAELRGFLGMTLPLGHLSKAVGTQVDGILGMNAMAYAPFALAMGKGLVTWYPEGTRRPAGTPLPVSQAGRGNALFLEARAMPRGETFPVLIDSGASLTFLGEAHWPQAKESAPVALSATGVNASRAASFREGRPGSLFLGDFRLPVRPLLGNGGDATLGADALRGVTLLIDVRRRAVTALEAAAAPESPAP